MSGICSALLWKTQRDRTITFQLSCCLCYAHQPVAAQPSTHGMMSALQARFSSAETKPEALEILHVHATWSRHPLLGVSGAGHQQVNRLCGDSGSHFWPSSVSKFSKPSANSTCVRTPLPSTSSMSNKSCTCAAKPRTTTHQRAASTVSKFSKLSKPRSNFSCQQHLKLPLFDPEMTNLHASPLDCPHALSSARREAGSS